MNYRVLFITSLFIILIGFGGLFMLPNLNTENSETTVEAPQQNDVQSSSAESTEIAEKTITVITLNRDLPKGSLLQSEDYSLSELKVGETDPLTESDLKPLLDSVESHSLQGFLLSEDTQSGSLLNPKLLISPEDPRFILMSIDPTEEVAYRIYIRDTEQYLLDSLRGGDVVSIYSVQQDLAHQEREQTSMTKLADNFKVLQVKKFTQEDTKNESSNNKDYLGYVSIKMNAQQVKEFYSLDKQAKLIALPMGTNTQTINHRGMFIRQLRGKNNAN
ncbi:hypothetical protein MHD_05085 [Mannheimia granulomatis]|uniref:RcpC n=1 Tax=Mannheimia granulomatis TaxID=85402 RepID=A0A011LWY6_9PAST|nr:flp operon protein C [Mannheimia granulomatis]EXI61738.1 RcpC [Mannheimia granulomatis]RGE48493.1 hypothetical protein MHD_05085 [Mannheimia granulomatis]